MEDSLKTRMRLILGFKIMMLVQILSGLWQLIGAYIILGSTLQVYLLQTYSANFGFNANGVCVVSGRCSLGTTLDDQIRFQRPSEIGGIIVGSLLSTLLTYYYLTVAKRLIALWA